MGVPKLVDDHICLHKCEKRFAYLSAFIVDRLAEIDGDHERVNGYGDNPSKWRDENCNKCAYEVEHVVSCGVVRLKQEVCRDCWENKCKNWQWRDDWDGNPNLAVRCPYDQTFMGEIRHCYAILYRRPPKWCERSAEHG